MQALPWAVYQANCLRGIILPHSPHRIVFGREPPALGEVPSNKPQRVSISCEEWFQNLDAFRKNIQALVIKLHEKARYRSMQDFKNSHYVPGDKVWVRNSKNRTDSTKLDPLWTGPCEILERVGNSGRYKVSMPKGVEYFHMDDFKPYLSPPNGKAIPFCYFQPREAFPESDDYVVEKIVDHKIDKGRHLWRVRWRVVMAPRKIPGSLPPIMLGRSNKIGRGGMWSITFPSILKIYK